MEYILINYTPIEIKHYIPSIDSATVVELRVWLQVLQVKHPILCHDASAATFVSAWYTFFPHLPQSGLSYILMVKESK